MNYIIVVIIVIIIIIIIVALIFYISNPLFAYSIMKWWGCHLSTIKKKQNSYSEKNINLSDENIPSLMKAKDCPLESARKLEDLISRNHDQILTEIKELLLNYKGVAMADVDEVQGNWLKGSKNWRTLWVKFLDTWAGTADSLPTLKGIVEEMGDDVTLLHVSILHPKMRLDPHYGIHSGVWRYHYGLIIPEGDTGLSIEGHTFKWKEREGVIWDDTLLHSAWNETSSPRIIIFADLPRDLHPITKYMNTFITRVIQSNSKVKSIAKMLSQQNIKID